MDMITIILIGIAAYLLKMKGSGIEAAVPQVEPTSIGGGGASGAVAPAGGTVTGTAPSANPVTSVVDKSLSNDYIRPAIIDGNQPVNTNRLVYDTPVVTADQDTRFRTNLDTGGNVEPRFNDYMNSDGTRRLVSAAMVANMDASERAKYTDMNTQQLGLLVQSNPDLIVKASVGFKASMLNTYLTAAPYSLWR